MKPRTKVLDVISECQPKYKQKLTWKAERDMAF